MFLTVMLMPLPLPRPRAFWPRPSPGLGNLASRMCYPM